jgi:hypothetical protein
MRVMSPHFDSVYGYTPHSRVKSEYSRMCLLARRWWMRFRLPALTLMVVS